MMVPDLERLAVQQGLDWAAMNATARQMFAHEMGVRLKPVPPEVLNSRLAKLSVRELEILKRNEPS